MLLKESILLDVNLKFFKYEEYVWEWSLRDLEHEERDIILKQQHIHNLKKFFLNNWRHDIVNIKTNNYTGKVQSLC